MAVTRDLTPSDGIVPLFEQRASATPDAVAVVFGERRLTYGELDRWADDHARQLRERGAGPDTAVGVLAGPGPEMIAGALGVLKSGAGYVPLDPGYPRDRLDFLVADSGAVAVVAQDGSREAPGGPGVPVIATPPDPTRPATGRAVGERPSRVPGLGTLAYVVYTSGTTGRPKGVEVTHRNIASTLRFMRESGGWRTSDTGLLQYSFSFDSSVVEIFAPLTSGARLVIASERERRDPAALLRLVRTHRVTQLDLVPALLAEMLALPGAADALGSLRMVISGGDVLRPEVARRFHELLPGAVLENHYGPTETTNDNTVWRCVPGWTGPVPIGHPVAGSRVHLLDAGGTPVPDGTVGEIHIGGPGVARGYRNRPDLTAERFLPDPHSDDPAARLYRTGDLGHRRPDGAIEFHGRADRQLSVRGFRVEPEEIEARLAEHPSVRSAAVGAPVTGNGGRSLVAYVTPAGAAVEVAALRQHLEAVLPAHMVPTHFVVLAELPLNANGKVDHRALPLPESVRPELSVPYVAAYEPDQQALAALFADVLGFGPIGVNDDFFELGGHSLLAIQAINLIRARFSVELPLSAVFDNPTVAALASAIEAERSGRNVSRDDEELRRILLSDAAGEPVPSADADGTPERLTRPGHILLTGATDFTGVHLLQELLASTGATVTCLVRADTARAAQARLYTALHVHRVELAGPAGLRVVPGDLRLPRFGLEQAEFDALADSVDVVFHNAADNNLVRPYTALRAANVVGTREVLDFAARGRIKAVHFSSTISVMPWKERPDHQLWREEALPAPDGLTYGYAQTKWVAEALVGRAQRQGVPATVLRIGRVVGSTRTGVWPGDDLICRLIEGGIAVGALPERAVPEPWLPVDQVVGDIVRIAARPEAFGQVLHLTDGPMVDFDDVAGWVREYGLPVQVLPVPEWTALVAKQEDNPAYPVLGALEERPGRAAVRRGRGNPFDHSNVTRLLGPRGVGGPTADTALLHRFLDGRTDATRGR